MRVECEVEVVMLENDDGREIEQVYVYRWGLHLPKWKGRQCRVIARGKRNSALVQFLDNSERAVISRNALRKVKA